jgi:Mrp family chromosome partitioning ATPase/capsular polysaccharide biosynthesis protein/DNA-binding winged helix-turn-helix (wHTH) protein
MTVTSSGPDESALALRPYVRAIRARSLVVAMTTIAALAVAAALLATREPTYTSTAQLLVTPLPQDDRAFLGTTLLRDSGDPTRTVQTAAALIASPLAAQRTARRLGGGIDQRTVEANVDVQPLGESNILSVTASSTTRGGAARLANEYAQSALAVRDEEIRSQIDSLMQTVGPNPTPADKARLAELRAVRDRGDPTLLLSQSAQAPLSSKGAPAWLVLLLATIAGFTLGSIAALLLLRRIADERELVEVYPLPILARVPVGGRRREGSALDHAPSEVIDAFRSVRLQLELEDRHGSAILVTSASRREGKTLSTIDLARELISVGRRVVLVDLDLRRPELAAQLGVAPGRDLLDVMRRSDPLADALHEVQGAPLLRLASPTSMLDARKVEQFEARLPALLAEARTVADYVLVDGPPLGEVSDALHAVPLVDHVIVVARIGRTSRSALETARDLLRRAGRAATGYIIVGGVSRRRGRATYPTVRVREETVGARMLTPNGRRLGDVDGSGRLVVGDLRMDLGSGKAWRGTDELVLAPTSRRVLERLMRHPGEVVSRAELFAELAGENGLRRPVDVDRVMRELRLQVDRPFALRSIETVRGSGYRLRADGGRASDH